MSDFLQKESLVMKWILIVSLLVFAAVVVLFNLPQADTIPAFVPFLPKLNAFLNGSTFIVLLLSLWQIKKKNIESHKRLNILAFVFSSIFLLSYVLFHSFGIETKFPADNPLRPIYLFILLTHILLAAFVLPAVLVSFYYGLTGKIDRHRKIVRFTYPVWLYVTFTGVVVYLMISPYYSF